MTFRIIVMSGLIFMTTPHLPAQTRSDNQPILLPVPGDPTVAIRIWFKVGSQNDPVGKEGLAAITAAMLTEGSTKRNSYEQILDLLFPLASSISVSSSVEMTVVVGRTHRDNLEEYYPLLLDGLLAPAFREIDLERIKSRALNTLENVLKYSSDEELGKAVLYQALFDGTPYGHLTTGTIPGVRSITIADVQQFYAKYFTRENVVIGLGGGFDDTLVKRLSAGLQKLPPGTPPIVAPPVPPAFNGIHVTIIEKPAQSTAISMGFPISLLRGSREWYALAIANSWLGEHRNSSSHLYQVIREERGLNYGDYSYIENFPNGGRLQMPPQNVGRLRQIFEIWIRPVPNEARHFALRAALREFQKLVNNGLSESAFNLTRNFLRKYVLHYAPTTMERLGYAIDDRFYDIRGSHLEQFRAMMDEITLEEVNAAIRKHWNSGAMQIAIITEGGEELKRVLMSNAPSPITYSSPKPPEVLDEDKEIAVYPIPIAAENLRIMSVDRLFMKR